jgi:hypothetical protein
MKFRWTESLGLLTACLLAAGAGGKAGGRSLATTAALSVYRQGPDPF